MSSKGWFFFKLLTFFQMGLVCFRLKGTEGQTENEINELNKKLLTNINGSGKLHMVPASVHDKYIIRFCVAAPNPTQEDMGNSTDTHNSIKI